VRNDNANDMNNAREMDNHCPDEWGGGGVCQRQETRPLKSSVTLPSGASVQLDRHIATGGTSPPPTLVVHHTVHGCLRLLFSEAEGTSILSETCKEGREGGLQQGSLGAGCGTGLVQVDKLYHYPYPPVPPSACLLHHIGHCEATRLRLFLCRGSS